jgi:hypothetical protein
MAMSVWLTVYIDDNMVHGDQLNEVINACMSLVCMYVCCLSPFACFMF